MKFDLKGFLKTLKLNENTISMILGIVVILVTVSLVINYFRDKSSKGNILEKGAVTSETAFAKTHLVTAGETLWKIAESETGSGYNWVDIAKANEIKDPNMIVAGQKLTIPSIETVTKSTAGEKEKVVSAEKPNTVAIGGATYEVVKGDSLWNIAVRSYGDGYKWIQIARDNHLANPNLIHPGNILALPR
jgi:nucleoid-associated protein YgaU